MLAHKQQDIEVDMAKKKTFVMYEDWGNYILNLPKDMAGELSQMIMAYSLYGEMKETDNPAIQAMFNVIKEKIDDDYMKWLEKCDRNRRNRLGEDYDEKEQDVTSGDDSSQVETNGDDSDYDYHTHIHNHKSYSKKEKIKPTEIDKQIIDYLNKVCDKNYGYNNQDCLKKIHGRLREKHTVEDFKRVIDNKAADWKSGEFNKFLRPSTLFCPKHFEEYLNERPPENKQHTDFSYIDEWVNES